MAIYAIYEGNMETLKKKIFRIKNKCAKYNCDFSFSIVGEEFRDHKNPLGFIEKLKFYLVEAEGKAEINGWRFVGVIDHSFNTGNVITKAIYDIEIPERFYTAGCNCEHCKVNRWRAKTYLIQNTETKEIKQVGKSCLKDYTNGLDADLIACILDGIVTLEECGAPNGVGYKFYYPVDIILQIAFEAVRKFGYIKVDYNNPNKRTTKQQVYEFFEILERNNSSNLFKKAKEEIERSNFNYKTEENENLAVSAIQWIKSQNPTNEYMKNLRALCSKSAIEGRYIGILASLAPTYLKTIEQQEKKEAEKKVFKSSTYKYNVGERVTFSIIDIKVLTSYETQFGVTVIYRFVDTENNIYIWKTTKHLDGEFTKITGTVKELSEYNGIKQTVLTRCKLA